MTQSGGWSHWSGRALVLAQDNIDTDQIYPGRFLSLTNRTEMAPAFFADWRFAADGSPRADSPFAAGQSVLVAGENFGCGSSREHAVWVMRDHGFRVVLALSFAPIFRQNAVANGIAPLVISRETHDLLAARRDCGFEIEVYLPERTGCVLSDGQRPAAEFNFAADPFDILCLRDGVDPLGFLLSASAHIDAFLNQQIKHHSLQIYFSKGDSQ